VLLMFVSQLQSSLPLVQSDPQFDSTVQQTCLQEANTNQHGAESTLEEGSQVQPPQVHHVGDMIASSGIIQQ
jgi:hypothetical protein